MRDIRRRIKSVKSTQHITKAMKMVSAAKLRRSQTTLLAARPYADKLTEMIGALNNAAAVRHAYLREDEIAKVCFVVFAADKGLCGGYNSNLLKLAQEELERCPYPYDAVVIGKKAKEFFARLDVHIVREYYALGDNPDFIQAKALCDEILALYDTGTYQKLYFVYTNFRSAMSQTPVCKQFLPLEIAASEAAAEEFIYEPDEETIVSTLIPSCLETTVFRVLLESKASEHGARMTAMSAATDNAVELIDKLTLSLNRARQAAITTEITEIVGGAAALE